MPEENVRLEDLRDDLPFGSRVRGATRKTLKDEAVRRRLKAAFEDRGVLIFEDVESSVAMHLAISEVFGPLKEHPDAEVRARAPADLAPGVVDLVSRPGDNQSIVELDGRRLSGWVPWHFDLPSYDEINRAGVLRPVVIAPDGGETGFADGIELYKTLPPALREKIDGANIIYTADFLLANMRFGRPDNVREIKTARSAIEFSAHAGAAPRALHPAVWTRTSGETVLHVSTVQSVGIEGRENAEGDAVLHQVCAVINANPSAYYHRWSPNQILVWDNWRMLHCVTGTDPANVRRMHRTTVEGDYGLGRYEKSAGGKTAAA